MAKKKMVVVDPEKIEWKPFEHSELPEGALAKTWTINKETGAVALLVKFDEGFHETRHTHPSDNFFTFLEGERIVFEGKKVKKGMYFFTPAGVEHGPLDVPEGCVLFAYFNGPVW